MKYPNFHISHKDSYLTNIDSNFTAFVRKSFSDKVRIDEYNNSVYFIDNHFSQKILDIENIALIDLGANIGLSSLSICSMLPNIKKVIGVEAEHENFMVLSKNFKLWSETNYHTHNRIIDFIPIYSIASNADGFTNNVKVTSLSGGVSASGIFTFDLNSTSVKSSRSTK